MNKLKETAKYLFRSLRRFISLGFILLSMIVAIKIFELFIISDVYGYPRGSFIWLLYGLKYDLIFYLRASAVLMLPFLIISFFSPKVAKTFFMIVSVILILGDFLLLQYFTVSRVPLGADFLGYSLPEIFHSVAASGEINILYYLVAILVFVLMIRIFIIHVYFKIKPWIMAALTLLMVGSLFPVKQLNPEPSDFDNEFSMFLATNKLDFFFRSISNRYLRFGGPSNWTGLAESNIVSGGNDFVYLDPDYPFLHKETTPDNLGRFFGFKTTPPNIVIIIVESLGRAYCGEGAYLGSFTPFLDSLEANSLYWENCLSTSGRTFQVLPSLLASVPFGKNGFAEMAGKMPAHLSLPVILGKQSGYKSMFLYGGDTGFDKMDIFLRCQGVDPIIGVNDFGAGYSKLPSSKGFSWGYGDRELFRKYIEIYKNSRDSIRLDLMLTLAIHDPFEIPDQNYYSNRFDERLKELDLSERTKAFDQQFRKQLTSVLYFDDALRYFFDEMKKLPSFANTVFIITGDHGMPEIPISTQIDRFHVPLVIYSPLLNTPQKFSSVVSHFDLTPSLLALFDNQKFIKRPQVVAWVGHGLDNEVSFRNLNSFPLMRNKNEILDFINSDYFLSANNLYRITPNLGIEPFDSTILEIQLKKELDRFIYWNNRACDNNKLIPDSLIFR